MTDPIVSQVIEELRSRSATGQAKYGVTLARRDLTPSQWARHHREELLDAADYSVRVENALKLLERAKGMMETLSHECGWESAAEWLEEYGAQFGEAPVSKPSPTRAELLELLQQTHTALNYSDTSGSGWEEWQQMALGTLLDRERERNK